MTIKKSLISVVASAAIIAAITGCSSNSTTSSSSTSGGSAVTSITATDGYVINYTATATVSDGNSSTSSNTAANVTVVPLPLGLAAIHSTKAAGATATTGSATIDLTKDLTDAQIANLVSVNVSSKTQSTDGTTINYATFFDANADGKFSTANGDLLAPAVSMSAPVGYANITPITTLVNARIAQLTVGDTNDTARATDNAAALATIAAGLGLTADKIQNVDPMDSIATDPGYALINSMVGSLNSGDMTAVATALASATAATTTVDALTNVATATGLTAGTAAWFGSAAALLAADSTMINSVSSWNLDATRAGLGAVFTPVNSSAVATDFNVTAVNMSTNNVATLTGAGAKIQGANLDATTMTFTASSDTNVTGKPFTLLLQAGAQQLTRAGDANVSSITISIPLEMNNTIGATNQIDLFVSGDVTWEGINNAGTAFSGEVNATTFNAGTGTTPTAAANGGATAAVITLPIDNIFTYVDGNASGASGYTNDVDTVITRMKIALVDLNSTLTRTNGTAGTYWGNTAVASTTGGISATGKTILNNSLVDTRIAGAIANKAPQNTITLAATAGSVNAGTGTAAAPFIVNKNSTLSISVTGAVSDLAERNTTITLTESGIAHDMNLSVLPAMVKGQANVATTVTSTGSDINTTSVATGDLNTTLTTVASDEFGESNTTKWYFTVNRPVYTAAGAFSVDNNSSQLLADYDGGTTGSTAQVAALAAGSTITILTNNNLLHTMGVGTADDLNLSTGAGGIDSNLTIAFLANGYLELNRTMTTASIADLNFSIVDINATDAFGMDYNETQTDANTSY